MIYRELNRSLAIL
ncbi:hypothetical protein NMD37_01655 [Escherichia coli]